MLDEALKRTAEKLEAEHLRTALIRAGLYLAAFELLRSDIVDRTKEFFLFGFDSSGLLYSPDYKPKCWVSIRIFTMRLSGGSLPWMHSLLIRPIHRHPQ